MNAEGAWPAQVIEDLAAAYHDLYRRHASAQGSDNPAASLGWHDLPESLRESNRATARALSAYLAAMGLTVRPATGDPVPKRLPADAVERAARDEHERWAAERRARGYVRGPADDDATPPTHPDLADWDDLDEDTRDKDRIRIADAPRLLARLGLEIVPLDRRESEDSGRPPDTPS